MPPPVPPSSSLPSSPVPSLDQETELLGEEQSQTEWRWGAQSGHGKMQKRGTSCCREKWKSFFQPWEAWLLGQKVPEHQSTGVGRVRFCCVLALPSLPRPQEELEALQLDLGLSGAGDPVQAGESSPDTLSEAWAPQGLELLRIWRLPPPCRVWQASEWTAPWPPK